MRGRADTGSCAGLLIETTTMRGVSADSNGPANTLFYTAGPNEEADGAFGTVTANTP